MHNDVTIVPMKYTKNKFVFLIVYPEIPLVICYDKTIFCDTELHNFSDRLHLHRLDPQPLVQLQASLFLPRDETRIAFRSVTILSGTSSGERKLEGVNSNSVER